MKIGALGAGSDYSPFFQHLGIPSANIGYGGEGSGGEYHSIYDSYDHFTRFKDPGFQYGVTLAKTTGRAMLRLANADLLPFEYNTLVNTIGEYLAEVKMLIEQTRSDIEWENKLINEKAYALSADPTLKFALPKAKGAVPFLDFSPAENAVFQLKATAEALKAAITKADQLDAEKLSKLNGVLYQAEQKLLDEKGLPRRPWYRHQIYAPGFYTGYGVKTLPGVREGIEEANWKEAQERISVLSRTLLGFDQTLQQAISILH